MKIRELMTSPAYTCRPGDSLEHVARLLWDHDCGMLPVVDGEGRVGAAITDRDVCMGALSTGRPLGDVRVADSMSKDVVTCTADEDADAVVTRMCERQLHRLPVVDGDGRAIGVVTLNDLALAGEHDLRTAALAKRLLAAVGRHRTGVPVVVAAGTPAPAATTPAPATPAKPAAKAAAKIAGKGATKRRSAGGPA